MYSTAEEQVINSHVFNNTRVIGSLMLTQMILGILLNFWLLKPILLQAPLLLSQVVLPVYLIVKGFHTESITSI